ncbi:hypothetical protein BDR04DRAFT_844811 [Suillus decipiens]|nr:hypothetical protein BDR04DRAFT_844811 [Suillus decipiens]
MNIQTNNSSETPRVFVVHHATHPERDNHFRAVAASSDFLKENQKMFRVQCTQCRMILEKPLKCAKCKSIWYCSKECQKKNWPTHKLRCHEVERSSGALKFIRMFILNPMIMGFLKIGVVIDCGLLDNPRIGFDVPFGVRVDIAIEPSNILDFVGLYFDNKSPEEKLQGMVQVNAMTTWELTTPDRLSQWREARASCTEKSGNTATAELHFPLFILNTAKAREPILGVSAVTGAEIRKPLNAMTCLEQGESVAFTH